MIKHYPIKSLLIMRALFQKWIQKDKSESGNGFTAQQVTFLHFHLALPLVMTSSV